MTLLLHLGELIGERVLAGLTAASSGYCLASVEAARRFARSGPPAGADLPPISILKPVRGVDAQAYENYASFCRQAYPAYEILFGLQDPDDPAVELVLKLQQDFPNVPIRLVISDREIGTNRKVCNLHNLLQEAAHDLVLVSDSDMRVRPQYLAEIAGYFSDPQVGLVTSPYAGAGVRSFAAALEALGMGTDFFPGVAVASQFAPPGFGLGSTLALRRETLREIGGFEALADYLADDFQMGRRVAGLGRRVVLSRYVVQTMLPNAGLGAMLARRLRWMRTARTCQPVGFAGSIITHGTVWAAALLLVAGAHPWVLWTLAAQQGIRWLSAAYQEFVVLQDRELAPWFWLLPLSDLANFLLWAGSWCGSTVSWRGDRYRILPGGKMVRLSDARAARRQGRTAPARAHPAGNPSITSGP